MSIDELLEHLEKGRSGERGIEAAATIRVLRDHIREHITFAETRVADGKEIGAAVWRIALEDIARENRAALEASHARVG